MSQQSTASKPSLSGVKIKTRKRTVQAQAKYEPAGEQCSIALIALSHVNPAVCSIPRPALQAP